MQRLRRPDGQHAQRLALCACCSQVLRPELPAAGATIPPACPAARASESVALGRVPLSALPNEGRAFGRGALTVARSRAAPVGIQTAALSHRSGRSSIEDTAVEMGRRPVFEMGDDPAPALRPTVVRAWSPAKLRTVAGRWPNRPKLGSTEKERTRRAQIEPKSRASVPPRPCGAGRMRAQLRQASGVGLGHAVASKSAKATLRA